MADDRPNSVYTDTGIRITIDIGDAGIAVLSSWLSVTWHSGRQYNNNNMPDVFDYSRLTSAWLEPQNECRFAETIAGGISPICCQRVAYLDRPLPVYCCRPASADFLILRNRFSRGAALSS